MPQEQVEEVQEQQVQMQHHHQVQMEEQVFQLL